MKIETKQNIIKLTSGALCSLSIAGIVLGSHNYLSGANTHSQAEQELSNTYLVYKLSPEYKTYTDEKVQEYTEAYNSGSITNETLHRSLAKLDSNDTIYAHMNPEKQQTINNLENKIQESEGKIGGGIGLIFASCAGVSAGLYIAIGSSCKKKEDEQEMENN